MHRRSQWSVILRACLFTGFGGVLLQSGCTFGRDFRAAALPAVQSGVAQVLDGLLDGLFAAMAVENDAG